MESTIAEFWNRCEGQILNAYRLERHLGADESGALYSTEYGGQASPAVIKLMPADELDCERRLATWAELSQVSHPRLVRIFESGQDVIDGVNVLYVVMERSDGNLAGVLPEQPLTAAEAREMVDAAVEALSYLHPRGFVHGAIQPSNIVAVGEEIKLASDCIVHANEKEDASPAADVWSLGVTLVESLTQHAPELNPIDGAAAIPENLPQPFLEIARNCLRRNPDSRWTADQIASRLRGPQLAIIPPSPRRKIPRVYVALYSITGATAAAMGILLVLGRDRNPSPMPPVASAAPAASATAIAAPLPKPVAPPHPREAAGAPAKSGTWFVVAATYARQKDAEKRAQSITRKWPRFKAEVYAPPLQNEKPYYLVTVGSKLSQDAAIALQERTRAAGVARDAYITRFAR